MRSSPPMEAPAPRSLFVPWLLMAAVSTALMWVGPGEETVPYHVAWAGFALAYGLDPWSRSKVTVAMAFITLVPGGVLVIRANQQVIDWKELTEIPLMMTLMALMVWHVRRRQAAFAALTLHATREREHAKEQKWLTRLTSHEMRTPLTIARGYVELVLEKDIDPTSRADLAVVLDELGTLTRVCERLVRVIGLEASPVLESVDLDDLLRQTAERWAPVANRKWSVEADAGTYHGSAESLRTSLDTLIENALRYTVDGDTVRLIGVRDLDFLEIGVADSGAGMNEKQLDLINDVGGWDPDTVEVPRDELSQTGLGLGLVRTVVLDRGGQIRAARAPEGGALVVMRLPVDTPALSVASPANPALV